MWKGVVEIWRQVLGAEAQQTIGAHDDFFEVERVMRIRGGKRDGELGKGRIGGHSLLAIKLAKALGLSVAKCSGRPVVRSGSPVVCYWAMISGNAVVYTIFQG
eukprot:1382731-Amorphochlora_amoeboformis.AAC.1